MSAKEAKALPPLATEKALVNANRELIIRFEKKIHSTLVRVWGEKSIWGCQQ